MPAGEYVATPNEEVEGVCTRPQPAMSQPQSHYNAAHTTSSAGSGVDTHDTSSLCIELCVPVG